MSNQPISKLKDGLITASIWRNQTAEGKDYYAVTLSRAYMKNDAWQESYSFSGSELLRVSRLTQAAYDQIKSLQQQASKSAKQMQAAS